MAGPWRDEDQLGLGGAKPQSESRVTMESQWGSVKAEGSSLASTAYS